MSTRMQDLLARAREGLRYEPLEQRVRADTIVGSTRAILVWEPRRLVPSFAVPAEDIAAEIAPSAAADEPVEGPPYPGIPLRVLTAPGEPVSIGDREGAGFRPADDKLDGYVALDFAAFDAWFEEDELIVGHPRDPFHRVDVRRTTRPVRIEAGGEVLAETTEARRLFETSLPPRFCLPREAVRGALRPSARRTYCPYKGEASYWSLGDHEDIAWSYEDPLPDMRALTGLVAFWDERVEVYFDGERRGRAGGPIARALRDKFGV